MEITDVRIRLIENEPKLKAIAAITIDNAFAVHDIKVLNGEKGIFVAMPSTKTRDGGHRDIAHPINQEARDLIQKTVIDKYNDQLKQAE